MAGDNEEVAFSNTSPHFFTVIIKEKLEDNKLFIPKKFVKKYGIGFSSPVTVRLPCGSNWKMELDKLDDGQICLRNGWQEFMKHYSFGVGHFVVFRYEGNSHFYAIIFDKTATEIDYSSFPNHLDEPNAGWGLQIPKRKEVEGDDYVEFFDDIPCSSPQKQWRTSHGKPQSNSTYNEPENNDMTVFENPTSNGDVQKEEHGFPTEDNKDKSSNPRKRKYEVIGVSDGGAVPVEPERSPTNLTELDSTTPNNGRGASAGGVVQVEPKRSPTNLTESGGTTPNNGQGVSAGGAVQVEPERSPMNLTESGGTIPNNGQEAIEGGEVQVGPEISPTNLTESGGTTPNNGQGMPASCSNFPVKQARGFLSNPPNTWLNPVTMKRGRPLKILEKARILERVPFESENPFFKIVLQRTHVSSNDFALPKDFAEKYLRCKNGSSVTLRVPPSSRCWSCKFKVVLLKCGQYRPSFYNGWGAFALDNNLKVGNVCIFEFTNETELSVDVSIVRVVDNPYCQLFEVKHRPLKIGEKEGVLERAPFESEKPFFKIVMQPSSIVNVLQLPDYTDRYFKNKNGSAITLRVPPSRCWSCKYKRILLKCGRYSAKFNNGWKEFAKENNLKVGDVCIFELTDEADMTIDVSIIQGSEEREAPNVLLKPISNIVDTVELD